MSTANTATIGSASFVYNFEDPIQAELRFRQALESHPGGIIIVNAAGEILLVNAEGERQFGYSESELLGKKIEILIPNRFSKDHEQLRRNYLSSPNPRAMGKGRDLFAIRKDGSEFPVEVGLNPILNGSETKIICSVIDITELKKSERLLIESARQLQSINLQLRAAHDQMSQKNSELAQQRAELEDMFSIVAHDLKRPIVALQGLLSLVVEESPANMSERSRSFLLKAVDECNRMKTMVTDLAHVSGLTRREVVVQRVALRPWLDGVVDRFQRIASDRGVHVDCKCDPVDVRMTQSVVEEALTNILENAFHYGCTNPQPQIQIVCHVTNGNLELSVSDNGKGIAPENHAKVFEPFRRLDPEMAEGSGVGLLAAKRTIAKLGGDIGLESDTGQGAKFTIVVPVQIGSNDHTQSPQ